MSGQWPLPIISGKMFASLNHWKQYILSAFFYKIYINVDYLKTCLGQQYSDTKTRQGCHKKIIDQYLTLT